MSFLSVRGVVDSVHGNESNISLRFLLIASEPVAKLVSVCVVAGNLLILIEYLNRRTKATARSSIVVCKLEN